MHNRVFSTLLGAGLFGLAISMSVAQAETILVFGQNGTGNNFTATNNGTLTGVQGGTSLSAVDISVSISGIAAPVSTPINAYFNLSAVSTTDAYLDTTGHINQDFTGSFSITSGLSDTGINYLSGTFATTGGGDGATVLGAGNSLTLSASSPGGIPTFTSDVISELDPYRSISLAFANVSPSAFITANSTLGAFTSSVAGNFSAVPEPASVIMLGIGVGTFGLLSVCRKMRRVASV